MNQSNSINHDNTKHNHLLKSCDDACENEVTNQMEKITVIKMDGDENNKTAAPEPNGIDGDKKANVGGSNGDELMTPQSSMSNGDSDSDDFNTISRLLDTKPYLLEKWIKQKAPPDVLTRICRLTDELRPIRSPKRISVTSDLFQQWLASSPIKVMK